MECVDYREMLMKGGLYIYIYIRSSMTKGSCGTVALMVFSMETMKKENRPTRATVPQL